MARPQTGLLCSMCRSCRKSHLARFRRSFTSTTAQDAEYPYPANRSSQRRSIQFNDDRTPETPYNPAAAFAEVMQTPSPAPSSKALGDAMRNDLRRIFPKNDEDGQGNTSSRSSTSSSPSPYAEEPYHITVYAHRHNTHITFTEPSRNPILSFSCGSLGLRNAQKASYDASFQLAAYTFRKMAEKQWKLGGADAKSAWLTLGSIKKPTYSGAGPAAGIEVVMRGYGPGREAFQKALLGTEGRMVKGLIAKVTDGTRLKFGGTRSPQVRRLG